MERPRILCVDDEPHVLEGLQANLRRRFDVAIATSGASALEQIAAGLDPAVVVSDMRMPGMDGATLLSRVREALPDATRVLLTGHADLTSAIAAVNEGQIFRFLTKPCANANLVVALDAAVEQHRLITSERVLLAQTLRGSIETLSAVLALTNPAAFGRATRIKRRVVEILELVEVRERWQVEVSALLSQLGAIILPHDVAEKLYFGHALTHDEHKMVARMPEVADQLLGHIPRLEEVRAILTTYPMAIWRGNTSSDPVRRRVERGAAVLRAAVDLDTLIVQGSSMEVALETMRARGTYDPEVMNALVEAHGGARHFVVKELSIAQLRVGMVLAEDLKRVDGMLVLAHGVEISAGVIERLRNSHAGSIREPVRVLVGANGSSSQRVSAGKTGAAM